MSTASPRDIIAAALRGPQPSVQDSEAFTVSKYYDAHMVSAAVALSALTTAGYRVVREMDAAADALRWPEECPRGKRIKSKGGLIEYTILLYGGSNSEWPAIYRWGAEGGTWSAPCETYEAAKSAAQADYERRVVAALSPAIRALAGEAK